MAKKFPPARFSIEVRKMMRQKKIGAEELSRRLGWVGPSYRMSSIINDPTIDQACAIMHELGHRLFFHLGD